MSGEPNISCNNCANQVNASLTLVVFACYNRALERRVIYGIKKENEKYYS